MHADFPKLYSEISTDGAQRSLRWTAIEAITGNWTLAQGEMLARLVFGTKSPPGGHQEDELAAALAAFHQAFSDADPSIERGARQDQVLAAGVVLRYLGWHSRVALAVTTTACGGARKTSLPVDLVTLAENTLSQLGASRRTRPNLSQISIPAPEFAFEPDFAGVAHNSPSTFKIVFDQFTETVGEALIDLVGKFNKSTELLVEAGKKADEELDLLSWVLGQRSLLSNQSFSDLSASEKPLVFARDLASLTTIYPGPNSIPGLLSRAGVKATGKIKIADAVNAVSDDWTSGALKGRKPSPVTSPVHFALLRRQETGAGDGWYAGWSATTGIDGGATMSPIALAEQFYRENLWLR
ncbi:MULTISPECIES: GTPase-associated system all-helical protein GASH [Cupriavidus]